MVIEEVIVEEEEEEDVIGIAGAGIDGVAV